MKRVFVVALVVVLSACVFEGEDDLALGEAESAILSRRTLEDDLVLSCEEGTRYSRYKTSFQIDLDEGDTLLLGGDVLVEYTTFADDPPWGDGMTDELVQTWLACDPGAGISSYPAAVSQLSRTGQNVWQDSGDGSISVAHGTRGIYTAAESGLHTCWLIYACSSVNEWDGDDNGKVTIRGTSAIHHYTPNEYPGANWKLEANVPVTSTSTRTVQYQTWDAGFSTQLDTEVVLRWSPHVSTCLGGDDYCDGLVSGLDPGFEWRFVVRQYNGSALCHSTSSPWVHQPCSENEHHCDVKVLSSAFPIISGQGNVATCGTPLTARTFHVFAQMRKPFDEGPISDLVVHGAPGNPFTNLVMYSR